MSHDINGGNSVGTLLLILLIIFCLCDEGCAPSRSPVSPTTGKGDPIAVPIGPHLEDSIQVPEPLRMGGE